MANDKELIKKLFAIAEKQQKIITKLAQALPASTDPPPQHLDPVKIQKRPAKAVLDALPAATRNAIVNLEEHGDEMWIRFKPGQTTQRNYDIVLKTMQDLSDKNVLQRAYKLVVH